MGTRMNLMEGDVVIVTARFWPAVEEYLTHSRSMRNDLRS
jgi:hypothetical protein